MASGVPVVIGVLDTAAWGVAYPENIRQVCLSVAQCFDTAIVEQFVEPIRVEPSELGNPRTLFDRLDTGQVRVLLSARERLWSKFAYQFAHEFCHVLANFRPPKVHPTAWIEESLCETSSLFALRAMACRWRTEPPYQEWASYAPALHDYAESLLTDPNYDVPEGQMFTGWLTRSLPSLEYDDPRERRADYTVVARQLLPIFEGNPDAWRAVRYLNLWNPVASVDYFEAWRSAAPLQHHAVVNQIEQCLIP